MHAFDKLSHARDLKSCDFGTVVDKDVGKVRFAIFVHFHDVQICLYGKRRKIMATLMICLSTQPEPGVPGTEPP